MPGLIGCINTNRRFSVEEILSARQQMKYFDWYRDDEVFQDDAILASRTHLNVLGSPDSPYAWDECFCWVEGEVYNLAEAGSSLGLAARDFPQALMEAYRKESLKPFLKDIDGYFTAALYDSRERKLLLISDRLGLKPLFIWDDERHFAWASELKAFLSFKNFTPELRNDAIECFMDLGHLLGDVTWFRNVRQLGASQVLTVDLRKRFVRKERYWRWSEIRPQKAPFREAAYVLGELLRNAIRKRYAEVERIGVSLSGGLDSRALLAGLEKEGAPCYTFGQPGCLDIEIARMAAAVRPNPHTTFHLDENNWIEGRFLSVWKNDGMKSLLHTHFSAFHADIKELIDINLNGFIADGVLGGCFHVDKKTCNRPINEEIARKFYKHHHILDDLHDDFYQIDHIDPYLINNRCRRFVHLGCVDIAKTVEQRNPMVDNHLLEWVYGLPDEYRLNSRLYNNALLNAFPEYYEAIPWQTTGMPIRRDIPLKIRAQKKIQGLLKSFGGYQNLKSLLYKTGVVNKNREYVDYETWIRSPKSVALFSRMLDPDTAFYRHYIREDLRRKYLIPHIEGLRNYAEEIGRALTLESWLSQMAEPAGVGQHSPR